jgi:hypothetical protein
VRLRCSRLLLLQLLLVTLFKLLQLPASPLLYGFQLLLVLQALAAVAAVLLPLLLQLLKLGCGSLQCCCLWGAAG